jgi:DNA invertase Pin-like site-specific DNA recombinase
MISQALQMAADTQNRTSRRPQGRLIGYARVSTDEQATKAQEMELRSAGCDTIVEEHGSGASRARPALSKLVLDIGAGDTLVVVRLDRLARSVSHLLDVIEDLTAKGAHFRSLRDPIDTSTPQGMFSLQVLGAVAQLERALISERTKAGIAAAKAKGRLPGNPGIRERRPEMLSKMKLAQQAAYGARIQSTASQWLPTVKRMRPDHTWDDITRVLKQRGFDWTPERLRRAVKWMVSEAWPMHPSCGNRRRGAGASPHDARRRNPLIQSGAHAARNRKPAGATARTHTAGWNQMGAFFRQEPHRPRQTQRFDRRR